MAYHDPKDDPNLKLDQEIRPPAEKDAGKPAEGPEDGDGGVKPLRTEDITPPDGP